MAGHEDTRGEPRPRNPRGTKGVGQLGPTREEPRPRTPRGTKGSTRTHTRGTNAKDSPQEPRWAGNQDQPKELRGRAFRTNTRGSQGTTEEPMRAGHDQQAMNQWAKDPPRNPGGRARMTERV